MIKTISPLKEVNMDCTECGGKMEIGFLLDETHGGRHPSLWVAGEHEPSFLVGTKLKNKEVWRTESYRCQDCGFLKTYARVRRK